MYKKWIVLLTSCVKTNNSNDIDIYNRKNLYRKQILKWLKYTNLNIFIVESSGWNFPYINYPRFHVITFNILERSNSSSINESLSILYALDYLKNTNNDYYNECDYILKVTGRYFLENIEEKLYELKNNSDLYLQIHRNINIKWQNSEYYGIKKDLLYEFVSTLNNNLMEHHLYNFSLNYKYEILGPFDNNIPRGGDKLIIRNL